MKLHDIYEELYRIDEELRDIDPCDSMFTALKLRQKDLMKILEETDIRAKDIKISECPSCGGSGVLLYEDRPTRPDEQRMCHVCCGHGYIPEIKNEK